MIGERISQIRGNLSRQEFAEILGIHPGSLIRYEKGDRLLNSELILLIADKFNVSADWLLGRTERFDGADKGMLPSSPPPAPILEKEQDIAPETGKKLPNTCANCEDLIFIPRVNAKLSAGNGSLLTDSEVVAQYAFHSKWLHSIGQPSAMVCLFVTGTSMQPVIEHNDLVMLDQSQKTISPGQIYAVGVDDAILVKYIDIVPGQIILRSENEKYPPIYIEREYRDQIRILGRVVWMAREY